MKNGSHLLIVMSMVSLAVSCKRDDGPPPVPTPNPPVPATPAFVPVPANFPAMPIPPDNPFTEEGIALGRFLFYEEMLSGDNSMSCASCHAPDVAFTDHGNRVSTGIDGIQGTRNSMALANLAWDTRYFWDGRVRTLEEQVLRPVRDPIEMHETWPQAMAKLQAHEAYPGLFLGAFGTSTVDSLLVAKAIAQFMRTMISGNSPFDKYQRGEGLISFEATMGLTLWDMEGGYPPAVPLGQGGFDCFHCHPFAGGRFTDGQLHNNGLDSEFTDLGAGGITGLAQDMGMFKTPTLRNIALTAPYMHDGRFATLEEVVEHYNSGGHASATVDVNMKYTAGGLQLTPEKKQYLLAFLNSLTDMDFVNNASFQDPGEP